MKCRCPRCGRLHEKCSQDPRRPIVRRPARPWSDTWIRKHYPEARPLSYRGIYKKQVIALLKAGVHSQATLRAFLEKCEGLPEVPVDSEAWRMLLIAVANDTEWHQP